jgi:hypothetical protein
MTVTPACSVYNYGATTPGSYTVRMKIGTGYNNTTVVSGPAPDQRLYVTFPVWVASPVATIPVSCSTELASDQNRPNDRQTGSVIVGQQARTDVGCTRIVAPPGALDSGATITPACSVENFGNTTPGNYAVRMKIGPSYNNTVTISGPAPDQRIYVTFPTWTARPRGSQAVSCSTELGDAIPGNDKTSGAVLVRVQDVGATAIVAPSGTVDSGSLVAPEAVVHNYGNVEATFEIRCAIDDGYADVITRTVGPGADSTFAFADWTALSRNSHVVTCSTELAGDRAAGNDRAIGSVDVTVHDLAAAAIVAPTGSIPPGDIMPQARVCNNGTRREAADVTFRISSTPEYLETVGLPAGLPTGIDTVISFPVWNATVGSYAARCSTHLAGDQMPANDTASADFSVAAIVHNFDAGVTAILAPAGAVDTGETVLPQVRFENTSANPATFQTRFWITDSLGSPVYSDNLTISGLAPGGSTTESYVAWLPPHLEGSYAAHCSLYAALDTNAANNALSGQFRVSGGGLRNPGWHQMADVLYGPKNKRVKDGACLAYSEEEPDASSYIYALKGNNRCEFYRYGVLTNTWAARESIPVIGRSGKKKAVKKGATLSRAADKLYATKGNNTIEFWQYDPSVIAAYPWTQKADVPVGAKNVKEGTGAVAVLLGETTYVYLLKGSNTPEFYRFNTLSNEWSPLPNAPAGLSGRWFKNGSCLTFDPSRNTIYALKGSYNEFYAFKVDSNLWATKAPLPLIGRSGKKKKVKDGAGIADRSGIVYGLKGGNTQEFWAYRTDSNRWTQMEDIPIGGGKRVKGGGSLVAGADALWALKGNNTFEFWQYVPATAACPLLLTEEWRDNAMSSRTRSGVPIGLRIAPNPFTNTARITYSLPEGGNVRLALYDVTGKLVTTLASGYRAAGSSSLCLSAPRGAFPRGIYLLKLEARGLSLSEKLIME